MKKLLTTLCAAACAVAWAAEPSAHEILLGAGGWTPAQEGEYQIWQDVGLSSAVPFTTTLTVTMPQSVGSDAVISFGTPRQTQVSLTVKTFSEVEDSAYLSSWASSGGTNALLGEWDLPIGTFRAGETYDLALTYDGTRFRLYVDGKEVALHLRAGSINAANAGDVPGFIKATDLPALCLGMRMSDVNLETGIGNVGYDFFGGAVRNLVLFRETLDAEAVAAIHERGIEAYLYATYGADVEEMDGAYVLDSTADYLWYLSNDCPANATVRLGADIALPADSFVVKPTFSGNFDGQGHTLTLAANVSATDTPLGLLAGTLADAKVQDLKVRVAGNLLATGEGAVGALAGAALGGTTLTDVSVEVAGVLAGDVAVGGLVGQASGTLTLTDVRATLASAALNGATVGGLVGEAEGALAISVSTLAFTSGAAEGVLLAGTETAGAAIGRASAAANLAELTVLDTALAGATAFVGAGDCAAEPTLYAGVGSPLLGEGEAATLLSGTVSAGTRTTLMLPGDNAVADTPTVSEGWEVVSWDAATGALTLAPTGNDLAATGTLTYQIAIDGGDPIAVTATLSHQDEEGWFTLDSAADYEWYLASCPNGSKVRLGADITLEAKDYVSWWTSQNDTLTFDGQGHTLTLPEGATLDGDGSTTGRDYAGLVAGRLDAGTIKDVTIVIGGRVVARPYAGGVLGSGESGNPSGVLLENVTVRLLPTGVVEAEGNNTNGHVGALVGRGYTSALVMRDCTVIAGKGSQIINRDDKGEGADRANQTSATSGDTRTEEGVVVYDFGLTLPEGAVYSRAEGTVAYAASTQTADYGAAETFLAGEVTFDLGAPITLAPEALPVKEAALSAESASAGWLLARDGNVITLSAPEKVAQAGLCALTYTLEAFPDTPITLAVTANLDPPEADAEGWYTLDSERDYAWYLTSCPNNSKVRLGADITLLPKEYRAYNAQTNATTLEFDGQGHTVTLPEGATMDGNGGSNGDAPGTGGTTHRDYSGVIAGQLQRGSIRNVTVVVGGTVSAKPYCGAVLGSGTYSGGGVTTLENVHVRLLPTAVIRGEGNSTNGHVGGIVGYGYSNNLTMTDCSIVCESGSTITNLDNSGNGPERASNISAVCGDAKTEAGVVVVDFGVSMPEGAHYSLDTDGNHTIYRAEGVGTNYGEAIPFETGDLPAVEEGFAFDVAGEEAALADIAGPEGWSFAAEGGRLTVTGIPGSVSFPVELTYGFAGVPGLAVPVSVGEIYRVGADGWFSLATEADYAWYLTYCQGNSKVRLLEDITLKSDTTYRAWYNGDTLTFDGQGHTVTLPEGATMEGRGSTTGRDYSGVIAGQLDNGTIRNVSVAIGGHVVARPYCGGVLGSTRWQGKGTVTIENAHVRLLGTGVIEAEGNSTNGRAGGIVGLNYHGPAHIRNSTVVLEADSQIVNRDNKGTGADRADSTAAVCGRYDNSSATEENVTVLDMGVTMPEGAVYSRKSSPAYKASTVTADYGAAGTFLMGEQAGPGPWTLAPEGLTVQSIKTPAGWKASLDGNVLTLTGEPGQVELTYGLKGFSGVSIPLTLTVPAGTLTFVFPEGVAATDAQRAALADFAEGVGLSGEVAVSLGEGASLDALGLFEGILSAKDGGVSVDYAFAVTAIAVEGDEVVVTVGLNDGATFAEGTRVSLVPTEGEGTLGEPASAPGAGSVTIRFPRTAGTTLFRARAEQVDSER